MANKMKHWEMLGLLNRSEHIPNTWQIIGKNCRFMKITWKAFPHLNHEKSHVDTEIVYYVYLNLNFHGC